MVQTYETWRSNSPPRPVGSLGFLDSPFQGSSISGEQLWKSCRVKVALDLRVRPRIATPASPIGTMVGPTARSLGAATTRAGAVLAPGMTTGIMPFLGPEDTAFVSVHNGLGTQTGTWVRCTLNQPFLVSGSHPGASLEIDSNSDIVQ